MSVDRQIKWTGTPKRGRPTIDKLKEVAQEFLGARWNVFIENSGSGERCWLRCRCPDAMTYPLISEQPDFDFAIASAEEYSKRTRGFYVFFSGEHGEKQTAICTAQADEYSSALADQYAKIIARWWGGEIRWPT